MRVRPWLAVSVVAGVMCGCGVEVIEHARADAGQPRDDDFCVGRLGDFSTVARPQFGAPDAGASFVDPVFGTRVRRLTQSASGEERRPPAPGLPFWNADESLVLVSVSGNSYELYDAHTFALVERPGLAASSTGQVYWHRRDPDVLFYFDSSTATLERYSVSKRQHTTVAGPDARCTSLSGGAWYSSWSSSVFGAVCEAGGGRSFAVVADGGIAGLSPTTGYEPPLPTARGELVVTPKGSVYDLGFRKVRDLGLLNSDSDFVLGVALDGGDVVYALSFDGPAVGSLVAWPVSGEPPTVLLGPATGAPYPRSGSSVSATAFDQPRWVVGSSVGDSSGEALNGEIFVADVARPGHFCRIAHHHSTSFTAATLSPSGTRVAFASDWGQAGGPVDTYVVEWAVGAEATDGGPQVTLKDLRYGVGCSASGGGPWWAVLTGLLVAVQFVRSRRRS